VSGTYEGPEQFYVSGMGHGGGYAVAVPVVTATGAAVIVVRGSAESVPVEAPTGAVRVEGVLEPSQGLAAPLDGERITNGIQIPRLVSAFDEDLYAGYVLATATRPPDSLEPVPVPLPHASFWSGIRNLLYAIQWWAFAGFVVFMWWRMVREPLAQIDQPAKSADTAGSAGPPDRGSA
jgi:cytochrome oxidase assembly protein ShyY1